MADQPHLNAQDTSEIVLSQPQVSQCGWCCWIVDEHGRRIQPAEALLPNASHSICAPCMIAHFPRHARQALAELGQGIEDEL